MSFLASVQKIFTRAFIALFVFLTFSTFVSFVEDTEGVPLQVSASANSESSSGPATSGDGTKKVSDAFNFMAELFNVLIALLTFVMTPLIMLAGWLLSPDWTFGDIFGLRPILHSLWVFVSNIVYVIFAFLLLAIAFMNIFGSGGDSFKLQKALPKIVIWVLIVPFTWFIVSAVLSIANILTISVIQLPVTTIRSISPATAVTDAGKDATRPLKDKIVPKSVIVDITGDTAKQWKEALAKQGLESKNNSHYIVSSECPANCISILELLSSTNGGPYNMLTAYAYGIFRIDKISQLSGTEISKGIVDGVVDIFKKLGFGAIFFVMFAILLVALVFALFSRAMMLWIYAIFSPVFALGFVTGLMPGKFKDKIEKNMTITKFISLAMVPVYVSAALAFGLMFLGLAMNMGTSLSQDGYVKVAENRSSGEATFTFGEGAEAVELKTIGVFGEGTVQTVNTAQSLISTVIVGFLALGILWMAVMAALQADDITGNAVKPIADFGESMWKLITKLPQYAPIPIPGTGKSMTMQGLSNMGQSITTTISGAAWESGTRFGQTFWKKVAEAMGMQVNKAINEMEVGLTQHGWIANIKNLADPKNKADAVKSILKRPEGTAKEHIENSQTRNKMVDIIRDAYGLDDAAVKDLRSSGTEAQFKEKFKDLARKHENTLGRLVDDVGGVTDDDITMIIGSGSRSTTPITVAIDVANNRKVKIMDKEAELDREYKGMNGNDRGKMTKNQFDDVLREINRWKSESEKIWESNLKEALRDKWIDVE